MNRPGQSVRTLSIAAYVVAGLSATAGILVGLLPHSVAGFDAVCPSALGHLTGSVTPLQSVADRLSGAPCAAYEDQMMALTCIFLGTSAVIFIAGLIAGHKARRHEAAPPATGQMPAAGEPTHFPLTTGEQDDAAAGSRTSRI